MGDKSVATVQTPNDDLVTHPEFAPAYMDKVAFQKDVVVSVLMPVFNFTNQLAEDVKDTIAWGERGDDGCVTLLRISQRGCQQERSHF